MERLSVIIISLATLLNAILAIVNFIQRAKKPVDAAIDNKFTKALEPINKKLDNVNADIKRLDKNQCMNYLVEFIEDSKNGIPKDDIQKKRASEVFDHYTLDLHGNSYIHDGWNKYVK
ncbi:MAG: hypothetical protein IJV31_12270 [Clostridia bacterium]|nr:hypothetical protein [Clostridia bacterium]